MESRLITARADLWSAPTERSGDGAFPQTGKARLVLFALHHKSLNYNIGRAKSCQIVGWGERHDRIAKPRGLHALAKLSASATALSMALALFTVSWNSASGVESFTHPPPAWM